MNSISLLDLINHVRLVGSTPESDRQIAERLVERFEEVKELGDINWMDIALIDFLNDREE